MSLKKPTLKEIVEVLETLSEQGFIDVEPQERGYDLKPMYDFLLLCGIATRAGPHYWLRLLDPEVCEFLAKILRDTLEETT